MAKSQVIGEHGQGAEGLMGFGQGLLSSLDEEKKQKQQLLLALINSGQFQPATTQPNQTALQRFGSNLSSNLMGPNLSSPNPSMMGMTFNRVDPAAQLKQTMDAYGGLMGKGQTGGMQPSFSIDPRTGQMKSISLKPAPAAQSPLGTLGDTTGKSPEELRAQLAQTNPAYAKFLDNVVKGTANVQGRGSKFMAQIQEDAGMLYPDMDLSNVGARFKTRQDFTSGKAGQNIKSLNTAVNHLDELNRLIPTLGNTSIQPWNAIKNEYGQLTGNPSVARFNMVKSALTGELATLFKNSSGTDQEIGNLARTIGSSQSPKQLHAVVGQAVQLMKGRMNALQDQWKTAFGEGSDFSVISPRSKKILDQLAPEEGGGQTDLSSMSVEDLQKIAGQK